MKLNTILLAGTAMMAAPALQAQSLTNSNADGYVATTSMPGTFTLFGGDNQSGVPGSTTYTDDATGPLTISGTFDYSSFDFDGGEFDPAGYVVGGTQFQLSDNDQYSNGGSFSFNVAAGQSYGFYVNTLDNVEGRGSLSITSNAFAPASAVPEPATWAMMLIGFGMIGFGLRARRTTAKVNFA